jgi:hypothetical protein
VCQASIIPPVLSLPAALTVSHTITEDKTFRHDKSVICHPNFHTDRAMYNSLGSGSGLTLHPLIHTLNFDRQNNKSWDKANGA